MGREGTKKPKTQKCRVSVKREEHVHEQGVLFGPSGKVFGCEYIRNPPTWGMICAAQAGRLLVQVSTYMTTWLKRKAPHLSVTHNTHISPHIAMSKAEGRE